MDTYGLGSITSSAASGIRAASERLASASQRVAAGDLDAGVAVTLSVAGQQFAANVAVLKSANRMAARLLDTMA